MAAQAASSLAIISSWRYLAPALNRRSGREKSQTLIKSAFRASVLIDRRMDDRYTARQARLDKNPGRSVFHSPRPPFAFSKAADGAFDQQ